MPRRASSSPKPAAHTWQRHLGSPAFARELTGVIADDLRALAALTFKDVLDVGLRDLIDRWDDILAVDAAAGIVADVRKAVRSRARRSKRPLRQIMGHRLVAEIEAAIDDATNLSRDAEDFIDRLAGRDLIQSLLTDLVYTAIVSFNSRVNPLFGNLALRAIDAQIKSFIRMFMPMLQRQATAFLIDPENHALFSDFARAAMHQILDEPLPRLLDLLDRGNDRKAEADIRRMARDPHLRRVLRDLTLGMLDTVMREIGNRRVGSVLHLDANIDWLAKRLTEPALALLTRPHVAAFMNRAIERAAAGAPQPAATRRHR